MGAFGGLILTNRGRNLQVKAQTGVKLNFSRMAIGDGTLGSSSILELKALKSERKSLPLTKLKAVSGGQATLGSVLTNQDISSGFYFREIGIFATDPDVGEILYCYGNAGSSADYIPAGTAGSPDLIEKTIDVGVIVGNAANVTATINQSLIYETPEGAQEKADAAEAAANGYTDAVIKEIEAINQQDTPPENAEEGDLWLDTSDNTFQGTVFEELENGIKEHKADYLQHTGYAVATGSANTYIATLTPALSAYQEGVSLRLKINATNTGASTVNVNGLGAKAIKKVDGTDINVGQLKAGGIFELVYNGVNFQLAKGGSDLSDSDMADFIANINGILSS